MSGPKVDVLADVGRLAIAERAAWMDRNAKRGELRAWRHAYLVATGEWYAAGGEPEDDDEHERLQAIASDAQKALSKARAATRRAIANIGETK